MFLDDEEATARIRIRRKSVSLWVAVTALVACTIMMFALIDTAGASEVPTLSQVVAPQLLLDTTTDFDHRILYGALMVVFSVAAAGLWRLSLRQPPEARARSHGGRVSRS